VAAQRALPRRGLDARRRADLVEEIAASLPKGDEMIKALNEKKPITEAHFDEIFPRGADACVLALKDERGRIIAAKEVDLARRGDRSRRFWSA
jgi:hypothetical protein